MEKKMKSRIQFGIAALLLLSGLTACGDKIAPGVTPQGEGMTVKAPVATAQMTNQPFFYEAVGTVTARTSSTLSSKLMGVVRSVHVHEGDRIKKGDLLVTIDPRQVRAQLEQALANAEVAAKEYKRYQQLLKEQSASQQEYDRALARYREAQAAVAAARVSQKDASVRAPYDGRVVAKLIEPGDLASPGTPFLTVEQQGLFWTDLELPERYIQAVHKGLEVKVKVPALGNREITSTVGRIVPLADARSRSILIKVAMPQYPDLKSGMFARVAIPLGGSGMVLVPETAIVEEGQLTGIYKVDKSGIARFRLVRTGKSYGEQVEVVSGLQADERYVSRVPLQMKDGAKVEAGRNG
jgi:RND family efflux transporter MFP subunit